MYLFTKCCSRNEQLLSKLIVNAVKKYNFEYIVLSQDQTGKAVAPGSCKFRAGHISGAVSFPKYDVLQKQMFFRKSHSICWCSYTNQSNFNIPNSIPPKENKTNSITELMKIWVKQK